ncbi:MAG: response regulator [Pseudomonadota bacterium]
MELGHCMIVERSSVVRKVASRILAKEGVSTAEFETFDEAISACQSGMPQTIIVDTGLPDGRAFDLIHTVRAMKGGDKPVIIALMVERDLVTMTKAKRVGVTDFMLKPFDRNQLVAAFHGAQNGSMAA